MLPHARALHEMGLHVLATRGTAEYLNAHGVPAEMVYKVLEGRPNVVDDIKNGTISLIINTPLGHRARQDEYAIGWTAIKYRVPFITTLSAAEAIVRGMVEEALHIRGLAPEKIVVASREHVVERTGCVIAAVVFWPEVLSDRRESKGPEVPR